VQSSTDIKSQDGVETQRQQRPRTLIARKLSACKAIAIFPLTKPMPTVFHGRLPSGCVSKLTTFTTLASASPFMQADSSFLVSELVGIITKVTWIPQQRLANRGQESVIQGT
jgi:hypothetical protein